MPNNEFSFEQTNAMRQAIDIVICHLGGSDDIKRQTEVARVVLITAISRREYDADTLANLTIEQLREPSRKTAKKSTNAVVAGMYDDR
jgi:hypothetical protein